MKEHEQRIEGWTKGSVKCFCAPCFMLIRNPRGVLERAIWHLIDGGRDQAAIDILDAAQRQVISEQA